jgi:hypothetical protein
MQCIIMLCVTLAALIFIMIFMTISDLKSSDIYSIFDVIVSPKTLYHIATHPIAIFMNDDF